MIYRDLHNLVSDSSEEECNRIVALLRIWLDSCWLKLGSFYNNDVSLLKYKAMKKNLIDHSLMVYQFLHHCFIFKKWYIIIRKGSQFQSTRLHSDFNQCNCTVALFFRDIQYQIAHIVDIIQYYSIDVKVMHFFFGKWDNGFFCPWIK